MATETENKISKTEPKDVFIHLLAIIALYASATAFLIMLFQYINVLIPDILERGYYQFQSYYSSIRWAISSLIVIFPVYVWRHFILIRFILSNPKNAN